MCVGKIANLEVSLNKLQRCNHLSIFTRTKNKHMKKSFDTFGYPALKFHLKRKALESTNEEIAPLHSRCFKWKQLTKKDIKINYN